MRKQHAITTAQVLEKVKSSVAPLPSQKAYIKDLAGLMAMHINRNLLIDEGYLPDELPIPTGLIVAPTGQGKTFLLRKMAKALDLNVITVDCSTLVGESYKGVSLSQRIAGAMEEAKNQKAFQQSLLFFDEVDKLCSSGTQYSSGMTSILQLFNGGSVAVSKDDRTSRNIDTSRFMVLMGGAFSGLENVIRNRVSPRVKIGFDPGTVERKTDAQCMQEVTAEDLVKYGLMRELVGRVGTILVIPPLNQEDYMQLLTAEAASVQKKYENYFQELYGVSFMISETGAAYLADKSMKSATGARAVIPLVNDLMRAALANVEQNSHINGVILDGNGEKCIVRYAYGDRSVPQLEEDKPQTSELCWHIIKAKSTDILVRKLCRYYRNTGADGNMMEQLEIFLLCAIPHLYHSNTKEGFVFESLNKLARITNREGVHSGFEDIIRRSYMCLRSITYSCAENILSGCLEM